MEVICESCQARFNVPDDKLPVGKSLSAACPKCKQKIKIEAPSPYADRTSTEEGDQYDAADKPFDFVEEDALTALVCENDPAIREKVKSTLVLMEYNVSVAGSTREALKRMRYHNYDLVVANEMFDTSTPDTNGVLVFLERLPMSTRRHIFVCMIGTRYRTMDHMMAFNKSVNMIINIKNTDEFGKILSTGITDNDIFYRVYRDTLKAKQGYG
ncbi:MAG: zinc-ribbon domain-containing protein [Desulfosarcina sp.]|nr:zinc-ribbon domain-containing protein [Desulfobacterales bacterium]